jgi:SPP1 family predicted phage head-tail adaptor
MRIIGKLDRRITIQKRTLTKDVMGGNVETWADHASAWAERLDKSGKESAVADAGRSQAGIDWRIRFNPLLRGLTGASGYRVEYGGAFYDIHHVTEEGRRDGMILKTLATEGLT